MSLDSLIHFAEYWDEGTVMRKPCHLMVGTFFFKFFIDVQLFCNVVFISAVQKAESDIDIYI